MCTKRLIGFLVISFHSILIAKEKIDFITALTTVYEQQREKISYEALTEQLWEFYQHPVDLNNTSEEELKKLHILSKKQINSFFKHVHKNGALVSIYELQAIPNFDLATIERILPFIKVEETYPSPTQGFTKHSKSRKTYGELLSRYERTLEVPQGYKLNEKTKEIPYKGSRDKLATRIKWKHPNGWGFGIATRKNPGEPFAWDAHTERYGFDLWSGYVSLENKRYLKKLVVGNYEIGYGQGLIVNAGFKIDKSGETIPIIRTSNAGIKPLSSFSKYGFRGIATTLAWKSLEQTIYYAYNSLDGKVLQDEATDEHYTKSIQRTGSHRAEQEIAKKAQIYEQIIGGTLVYASKRNQIEIGLNAVYSQYDIPIRLKKEELSYQFAGKENYNLGLFYRYLWHNLHFFGEGVLAKSGGKGGLLGVVASLGGNVDLSVLIRHYDEDFHSFYGKAFGENSSANCNEQGIYVGISIQPIKKLRVNAYYDYFHFPQPTTNIAEPSSGHNWLTKATCEINKSNLLLLQYKQTHKAKNVSKDKVQPSNNTKKQVAKFKNRKYKAHLKQQLTKSIALHSEIQASTYTFLEELTWGYAFAQSITYKLKKISLTGQAAWSDTDFDNKLYLYEKAPLYNKLMSNMYAKKGIKAYVMVGYKPAANWHIEGKYTIGWYPDEDHLGSGHDTIEGNAKNEIKLQLIYKF